MEIHPRRYNAALIAGFLWMVLVILLYYYVHRPITPDFIAAFGGATLDSASTLLFVMIAGGLGRAMRQRFMSFDELSTAEHLSLDALGGFGALALLIMVVGFINLSIISMVILLIIIVALTYRETLAWLGDSRRWIMSWRFSTPWERGLAFFIGFNLVLVWLMSLTPPTSFDTLTYHLVGAKLWVAEGRFVTLNDSHFFAFPAFIHTLYSGQMAILLGRITAAASLQLSISTLGIIAFSGYAARRFVPFAGLLSATIFITSTSFWLALATPYIDMTVMAYCAASFIAIDQWREADTNRTKWLILAAGMVGLGMAAKYTTVLWGAIVGLYVVNYSWRDGFATLVRNGLIYGVVATVVIAPWLIRNVIFYDNPVYPFGPATGEWDDLRNQFYFEDNSNFRDKNWWIIAFLPLTSTFLGIGGTELFDATIGPLYLLLVPFLLWVWGSFTPEEQRRLKSMLFLVGLSIVLWIATALESRYSLQTRLAVHLFPPLIVLTSVAFDRLRVLPEKPLNMTFLVRTFVAIILILTFINHIIGQRQREGSITIEGTTTISHFLEPRGLEYLAGIMDQTAYLEHNLGWYIVAIDAVNDLPDDANVLFLWETRTLYCDEPRITCKEDAILDHWWHARRTVGDGTAEDILESWRKQGYTHLLIWNDGREFEFDGNNFITEADQAEWERLPDMLEVVWEGEDIYSIYAIPSR